MFFPPDPLLKSVVLVLIFFGIIRSIPAEDKGYRQPAQEIMDLVDAPPTSMISISPVQTHLLILSLPSFPPIIEVA